MQLHRLCPVLPSDVLDQEPPSPRPRVAPDPINQPRQRRRWRRRHRPFSALYRLIHDCRKRHAGKPHSFCWRSPWSTAGTRDDAVHDDSFHDIPGPLERQDAATGYDGPKTFSYAELYIGSNGFSDGELLGSGGFGRVYRAVLPSDGTTVAVKRVAAPRNRGDGDVYRLEKAFAAELAAVAQLRHRNLVRLRGWCVHDEGQLLLVYDYMPNSSLDRLLFAQGSGVAARLEWRQRERVVSGLAAALFYLHEQLDTQIVHRDVKASNVMLDSAYNARLGDFGLARWLEHAVPTTAFSPESPLTLSSISTSSSSSLSTTNHQLFRLTDTSRIGGTMGYLPPESFQGQSGRKGGSAVTAKSDVFSFGVVVLEVLTGRRAVDLSYPDDQIVLLDWVRNLADDGTYLSAADRRMPDGSYSLSEMNRLFQLGLLCSLQDPNSRPTMRWVVEILSGNYSGELPALPYFRLHPSYMPLSSPSPPSSSAKTATTTDGTTTDTTGDASSYLTASQSTVFMTADNGVGAGGSVYGKVNTSRRQQLLSPAPQQPPVVVDAPREIPLKEIAAITNNFSDDQMAVELDFGTAYSGYLPDRNGNGGARVLVKRLGMRTCPALRARFTGELRNLGRLRHRNLVQLRGWCTEQGEMLVVYDQTLSCAPLGLRLFHAAAATPLSWRHRYGIARALASAVLYLHEEWDEQVIHRNITSSAVFLDRDMNPRLGSFALAEFLTRNQGHGDGHHVVPSTRASVRGIFGYMSPEYMETGQATTTADVYSFGVVVLEIVTGRAAVDFRRPESLLLRWARGRRRGPGDWEQELALLADPGLDGRYELREMNRLVELGLACTRSDPARRPSMREVVSVLDGNDGLLERIAGRETEGKEEWDRRNSYALELVRRVHAMGIQ